MGNCFERCCGRLDKRKYLRTRYNVERDFSIEFENLMDDEAQQEELPNCAVLPEERLLLANKQYGALLEEQRRQAGQIEAELVRQEEELRMEEEAYYEAKREAARVARQQKQKEFAKSHPGLFRNKEHWNDDSEWEIATGDEDFENFLESVKARSLAARTRGLASQVPIDAQSTSSSRDQRDSHTEASSIDLEWEHEAGMTPLVGEGDGDKAAVTEDDLSELAVSGILKDLTPDVLEWDMDFASEHMEKRSLLSKKTSAEEDADR